MTRINSLLLYKVPLTSLETYYMADGKICDTVDSMVLCVATDTGLEGWGEVCPIPHYLPAYAGGVAAAIKEMSPVLLGADPIGPEALMHKLDKHLQGHEYAKSAIDTALWDLTAKAANLQGTITVNDKPGHGVVPNLDILGDPVQTLS